MEVDIPFEVEFEEQEGRLVFARRELMSMEFPWAILGVDEE